MNSPRELPKVFRSKPQIPKSKLIGSLVVAFVGIFFLGLTMKSFFGSLTGVESSSYYAQQLLTGSSASQRAAAVGWVQALAQSEPNPDLRPDELATAQIARLLERQVSEQSQDHQLMAALYALLGFSAVPDKARTYLASVLSKNTVPEESLVFLIIALGRLGFEPSPELKTWLLSQTQHSSDAVRQASAMTLGEGEAQDSIIALKSLLNDRDENVRLNAAFALARRGQPDAVPLIEGLLERLNRQTDLTDRQVQTYVQALKSASLLDHARVRQLGNQVAQSHPNLKIRQAAKEFGF